MSPKQLLFLAACSVVLAGSTADILGDLFKFDLVGALTGEDDTEDDDSAKREGEEGAPQSNCNCKGPRCDCCVDFNISSVIDLGGPACVNMKYISKTEGISLNVSYGDSILHSQKVTDKTKKGTCMELFARFAEICARFAKLTHTEDGMTGCLNFEPVVLGEVTSQYYVGCFKMGPDGMVLERSANSTQKVEGDGQEDEEQEEAEAEEEEEEEEEDEEPSEEASSKPEDTTSFMEIMSQSAEDGLSFFSDLLGFSVKTNKKNKVNLTTTKDDEGQATTDALRKRKGKFDTMANLV